MSQTVTFGVVSMIAPKLIRAARASLDWTIDTLASEAGINRRTILRIEAEDSGVSPSQKTLKAIKATLESAGIEFIGTADGAPGIRMHGPPPKS